MVSKYTTTSVPTNKNPIDTGIKRYREIHNITSTEENSICGIFNFKQIKTSINQNKTNEINNNKTLTCYNVTRYFKSKLAH